MQKCDFYRLHQQAERPASKQPATKAPWCAHALSRVTVFSVSARPGGAKLLQCGGDLEKCPLPAQPPVKPEA